MTTHKDPSTITTISTTHLLCRAALVIITPLIAIWQNANPENRLIDLNLSIFSESSFPVSTLIAVLILTALLLLSKIVSSLVRRWLERYYINHDGSNIDGIQLAFHHFIRDSGLFDGLMNVLSLSNVAHLLRNHPKVIWQSLQLYWRMSVVKYGSSSSQNIEVFLPHKYQVTQPKQSSNRLIFFVHGGAWGSGSPSMVCLWDCLVIVDIFSLCVLLFLAT